MKFGQVIDYNMRIILLKNDTQSVVGKLVPDIFLKMKIEHISGYSMSKVLYSLFLLYAKLRAIEKY